MRVAQLKTSIKELRENVALYEAREEGLQGELVRAAV